MEQAATLATVDIAVWEQAATLAIVEQAATLAIVEQADTLAPLVRQR